MLDALTCFESGDGGLLRADNRLGASSMLMVARLMNTPTVENSMRRPVNPLGRPRAAGLLPEFPRPAVLGGLKLQSKTPLPRPLARPALLGRLPPLPGRPLLPARAIMLLPLTPASGVHSAAVLPPLPPCCSAIGVNGDDGPTSMLPPPPLPPRDASLPALLRRSMPTMPPSARSAPCI
jgi:hypothetical protein